MSLPVPLSVRIKTARADRVITRDLHSLSFRSVAPGGFAAATMSFSRPVDLQPDEVAHYASVFIYDSRNGSTVWEGRLEDFGRGVGSAGEVWNLAAVGPSAHAQDRTVPLIYIDSSLERFVRVGYSNKQCDTNVGDRDGTSETPCLDMVLNTGAARPASDVIGAMVYRGLYETGQTLARVKCTTDNGGTSSVWQNRLVTRIGYGSGTAADTNTWSTSTQTLTASVGGTPAITAGHDVVDFQIYSTTAGTGTDDSWGQFFDVMVRARLFNADGTVIGTYGLNYVTAGAVVNDLLGRLLTKYDGAKATVATTTHQIDQLAYPDGVTPEQILSDLSIFEPAYYWAAWESNAAGKHRFEYKAWPTVVRYEADVTDGYDAPGSLDGLYNVVKVRWRDPKGRVRSTRRTQTVAELDAAGLTRSAFIDLGDDAGSSANATKAGDEFLAEHRYPPNAGTLTIARPILDITSGRMVQPWEIRPGELIRVRGVHPSVDSLNATARDGVTVFRVVAVDYDAGDASAKLELDSYPRTVARALAVLAKRRTRRR